MLIPLLIPLLGLFIGRVSASESHPSPNFFFHPIAYAQKIVTDPATNIWKEIIDTSTEKFVSTILPETQAHLEKTGAAIASSLAQELQVTLVGLPEETHITSPRLPVVKELEKTGATIAASIAKELQTTLVGQPEGGDVKTAPTPVIKEFEKTLDRAKNDIQEILASSTNDLKLLLRSTFLACCWVGAAFFGAKLAYEGIKEHKGTIKSKETVKVLLGSACVGLAIYAVYRHFE